MVRLIHGLKSVIENFDGDKDVDIKYLKEHLIKILSNDILIHPSKDGRIITYIDAGTKKILTENWYKKQQTLDKQEERDNISILAGKIISEDIRAKIYDTTSYPALVDFLEQVNDDVPRSLKLMLDEIVLKNKRKPKEFERIIMTIAHIIISAASTRSFLSTILIGLGVCWKNYTAPKSLCRLCMLQVSLHRMMKYGYLKHLY